MLSKTITTSQDGTTVDDQRELVAALGEPVMYEHFRAVALEREKVRARTFGRRLLVWGVPITLVLSVWGLAGSALITPLPSAVVWGAKFAGAVAGIVLVLVLHNNGAFRDQSLPRRWVAAIFAPLLFAALFDSLVWEAANLWQFGFSTAEYERAAYPILHLDRGRRSFNDTAEIDPFHTGEPAAIPIPHHQYIEYAYVSGRFCITVTQRKSRSGAIQVLTDGAYTWAYPRDAQIVPC